MMKYELWHDITGELDPDESGEWSDKELSHVKRTLKGNELRLSGPKPTRIKGGDYDVYEIIGSENSIIRAKNDINSHCSLWHIF